MHAQTYFAIFSLNILFVSFIYVAYIESFDIRRMFMHLRCKKIHLCLISKRDRERERGRKNRAFPFNWQSTRNAKRTYLLLLLFCNPIFLTVRLLFQHADCTSHIYSIFRYRFHLNERKNIFLKKKYRKITIQYKKERKKKHIAIKHINVE